MSLATFLQERAKIHGSKVALAFGHERLTYEEWQEKSNRLANALLALGISKGDRVAILLPSSAEFMVCYLGVQKTGAWATPIDVRFTVEELDFLFQDCQPQALLSESPYLEALTPHLYKYASLRHIITLSVPGSGTFLTYQRLLTNSSAESPSYRIAEKDIAHLRYSSGTTGRPKAALITHSAEQTGARMASLALKLTERDVFILPVLPPSWLLYMVAYITHTSGTAAVVVEPTLGRFLEAISRLKGTALMGTTALLTEMLALPGEEAQKYDLGALRLCLVSGMPLRYEAARQFQERFDFAPISILGYTETTAFPALQPLDGSGKPGATGKMVPGWEYRIVDETGQALPPNQLGELVFRSPAMAHAYYNRPQATAEAFHEGWFASGDIGRIDENGFLFLMGRKKEIINLADKEIFPLDVEEALLVNPKVAEAAAIGIPGKAGRGAIKVALVLKKGTKATVQEMVDFCQQRLHLVLEEVEFRDSLPRTPSGKVRRADLKDKDVV